MRYVSWAACYEGSSDALYLDVLLPKVIRDMIAREGTELVEVADVPAVRLGLASRSIEDVTEEACNFKDAYEVIFIHSDTGGRGLERTLGERSQSYCSELVKKCEWPSDQCITITPRHETEAWLLSDGNAVTGALGFRGSPTEIGLPPNARAAERLVDPKQVLAGAAEAVAGRRRRQIVDNLFPAIAQRQDLDLLRASRSFVQFEEKLRSGLRAIRCLPQPH